MRKSRIWFLRQIVSLLLLLMRENEFVGEGEESNVLLTAMTCIPVIMMECSFKNSYLPSLFSDLKPHQNDDTFQNPTLYPPISYAQQIHVRTFLNLSCYFYIANPVYHSSSRSMVGITERKL